MFAQELAAAGLRAEGAPGGAALWDAVAAFAEAEARVAALRHADPVTIRDVGNREWVWLTGSVFASLLLGGIFGFLGLLFTLAAGAIVFLGRYVRYRRAWHRAEVEAVRARDARRELLLAAAEQVVGTPWTTHVGAVRTVCSPDGDWLRAGRRLLRDRAPGQTELDAALKAEAERWDAAVAGGSVERLDRAPWVARLVALGLPPPP